ncbi:MAG: hypothetical protein MJZ41_08690 [Bacteroidaceae bacterium]|nr:hypothetical protein [Bacteroidaceae bacterium]
MSLFNDDLFDTDEYSVLDNLFLPYKYILGEEISRKIKEFTIKMKDEDERLFDVLRRELSNWLVCDKLLENDIKFEIDDAQSPVYESGICRYGQYSPLEKKITLFIKNIPDDEFAEIKASTILHELMHAYFDCCLSRKPDLEFIEEPLAEAGMLDFLYQCNGRSFDNVLQRVAEKEKTSCIAHYGFGAYIHQQSKDEVGTLYELYYKILHKGCCIDVNKFIEGLNEYGEYKKIICKPSQDEKKYELLRSILKKVEKECK